MIRSHKRKVLTWRIRKRAYPLLLFQVGMLYLRSSRFRSLVKLSLRNRRHINSQWLRKLIRAYLLATNSRITLRGWGKLELPRGGLR